MSDSEQRTILTHVFMRLRRSGFTLSIGELLAAYKAIDGGWGNNEDELKRIARLLWWSSPHGDEFDKIWESVITTLSNPPARDSEDPLLPISKKTAEHEKEQRDATQAVHAASTGTREWAALPVRVPSEPEFPESRSDLDVYWPVSRRHMVYTWSYLRRPVPDGPENILDINATVERATHQGFYLAPVYRRSQRNDAQLILLIDQGGSMTPFHRFTRDLVHTACGDGSPIHQTEVFYFHNIPSERVYADTYLTESIPWSRASALWSGNTSILLVSDAGAARGQRQFDRIRATTAFLAQLKRKTTLIAWLNPMPEERWPGTSAQIVSHMVPMFQMDPQGFSNAIDVLRGQPSHYRSTTGGRLAKEGMRSNARQPASG